MQCLECFNAELEESVSTLVLTYSGKLTKSITILVDRCPKCGALLLNQDQANYIDRVRRALETAIRRGYID